MSKRSGLPIFEIGLAAQSPERWFIPGKHCRIGLEIYQETPSGLMAATLTLSSDGNEVYRTAPFTLNSDT